MANVKFSDYLRSLGTRPIEADDIMPLAPAAGATIAKTLSDFHHETLFVAILGGPATAPTSVSPTVADIAGYDFDILTEAAADAGFSINQVTGEITCPPEIVIASMTMYFLASSITSKDQELALYLRGNTTGDIKIATAAISNKQTEISIGATATRALPANEVLKMGVAYSVSSPIAIDLSTFEINAIA